MPSMLVRRCMLCSENFHSSPAARNDEKIGCLEQCRRFGLITPSRPHSLTVMHACLANHHPLTCRALTHTLARPPQLGFLSTSRLLPFVRRMRVVLLRATHATLSRRMCLHRQPHRVRLPDNRLLQLGATWSCTHATRPSCRDRVSPSRVVQRTQQAVCHVVRKQVLVSGHAL
jgi:hypothetical protein